LGSTPGEEGRVQARAAGREHQTNQPKYNHYEQLHALIEQQFIALSQAT